MIKIFEKIREFLKGKKTYLITIVGILGALIAYADGGMTFIQMAEAILAALGLSALRAGVINK